VIVAIYVLHIMVSLALILIVLLQTGKGAEMGAAFGGSSQTVFGSAGRASALSKLTAVAAVVFMITCLFLAWVSSQRYSTGVMSDIEEQPAPQQEPLVPGAAPLPPLTTEEEAGEPPEEAPVEAQPGDALPEALPEIPESQPVETGAPAESESQPQGGGGQALPEQETGNQPAEQSAE